MNTLLLGGNRFVGVEILWHLLHAGHRLTVLALDSPPAEIRPHIRWLQADRNQEAALKTLFASESFDYVVDNIAYEPHQVERLLAALPGRIGRYLLTSTTDVYSNRHPRAYREDQVEIRRYDLTGLSGADLYNYGKRSCEAVLRASEVAWSVLRPCMVSGPRDNLTGAPSPRRLHWFEESGRSHFWVSRVLDGGPILLCSRDEVLFKLVLVSDLARAATHILTHPDAVNQVYNVTGDEIWTNERLVRALATAAKSDPEIVHVPNEVLEQAGLDYSPIFGTGAGWTLPDNSKLKATGWQPTPAEKWLSLLLEANARPDMRTWYHTRIQEVALARHIQRHKQQRALLAAPQAGVVAPARSTTPVATTPITGFLSNPESGHWQTRATRPQQQGSTALESFYRPFQAGKVSGIGLGTWMGDLTAATDQRYIDAMLHAASRGINVFDTAINYRHMKAERCVGNAVRCLSAQGIPRQALCITSKGGYITHDADDNRAAERYLREQYLDSGLIDDAELQRRHSIKPPFIAQQLEHTLSNLGLATLDVYYLHNPEDELPHLGQELFYTRLRESFVELEKAVMAGKIVCYGLATWHGLRVEEGASNHLSLQRAVSAAQEAAAIVQGKQHHLCAVQLPFNVRDHHSLTRPTQRLNGTMLSALHAIKELGMHAFTSATVLQGGTIPAQFRTMAAGLSERTVALRAAYSLPEIGTALVGMRRVTSVEEALAVAALPALASEQILPHLLT
ncbi:MAG: aldo/keto reductase [Magnetococcales bacterium]|nr:aldo/keto reductase [Magnetococcales bacterium]MBF0113665.1 aldo/keto reductase [Magnetococcales bacterium]